MVFLQAVQLLVRYALLSSAPQRNRAYKIFKIFSCALHIHSTADQPCTLRFFFCICRSKQQRNKPTYVLISLRIMLCNAEAKLANKNHIFQLIVRFASFTASRVCTLCVRVCFYRYSREYFMGFVCLNL